MGSLKAGQRRCFVKPLCIPVILLLFASAAAAETLTGVSSQKNAIVAIYVKDANGTRVASGTGFVLDSRGLIATSCRLVSKWLEKAQNSIYVEFEGALSILWSM